MTTGTTGTTGATGRTGSGITRHALLVSAGAAGGALLAACGAGGTEGAQGSGAKTAQPVTINWATRTVPRWENIWPEAAKIYQERHPHVTVQLGEAKDRDLKAYLTAWTGGAGPDLAAMWGVNLVAAGRSGLLLAHDSYIKRDKFPTDDYVPYQLKAMQWQGKQFALPMYINVYPLYYNKAVFQRKGIPFPDGTWNWAKYQETLQKLTTSGGDLFGGPLFSWTSGYARIYANGGSLEHPSDPKKVGFTSQQALEALQWQYDRAWKDRSVVVSGTPEWNALGVKNAREGFVVGKLATMEEGSHLPATLATEYPDAVQDWDIALAVKGPVRRAVSGSIDAWAVWKESKVLDAVWEFNTFLQSAEYLDLQCRLGAMQHPRSSMQDRYISVMKQSIPVLADKNLNAFADAVRNKYAHPNGGMFHKDEEVWKLFQQAYTSAVGKNEQSVKAAFEDAARQAEALLAQE